MAASFVKTGSLADLSAGVASGSRRSSRTAPPDATRPSMLGNGHAQVAIKEVPHYAGSALYAVNRRPGVFSNTAPLPTGLKDGLTRGSGSLPTSRTRHAMASTYVPSRNTSPESRAPAAGLAGETRRYTPPGRLISALELASVMETTANPPRLIRSGRLVIATAASAAAATAAAAAAGTEPAVEEKPSMFLGMSPTRTTLATGSLASGPSPSINLTQSNFELRTGRHMGSGGLPGGASGLVNIRPPEATVGNISAAVSFDDGWVAVNEAAGVRHPWRSIANSAAQTTSGLSNLGNTCFMNSCLQCLINTKPLVCFFLSGEFKSQRNALHGLKGQLADAFGELVRKMWDGSSFIAPSTFKQLIGTWSPTFQGSRQHDAQEFLRFLLDGLHEDLNRVISKPMYQEMVDIAGESEKDTARRWWEMHKMRNDSFLMDLFCGQLRSSVQCMTCGHTSKAFDPFMDLSLTLPQTSPSATNGNLTLVDCLARFSREEMLTGTEAFYCSQCKTHQDSSKQISIWRLPPVLVLHFKRFAYNATVRRKLGHDIQFSLREPLDIAPYCSGPLCLNTGAPCSGRYLLSGVINHMGTMEGGHYTAHCRSAANNQWYEFDDSRVTKVAESAIGGPAAYILFYRLVQ